MSECQNSKAGTSFHYPPPWNGVAWLPRRERDWSRALRIVRETVTFGVVVVGGALAAGTAINLVLAAATSGIG